MNDAQRLWWLQAQADWALFDHLRLNWAVECQLLHYLQMATEKLSKAYFWRSGKTPPKSHIGFVRFLKALLDRPRVELTRIATVLGFRRPEDLERWVVNTQNLAYALQNMAPAEARDGPNPEYPWPHENPAQSPVDFTFPLWDQLRNTGQGRNLMVRIALAIESFDEFA